MKIKSLISLVLSASGSHTFVPAITLFYTLTWSYFYFHSIKIYSENKQISNGAMNTSLLSDFTPTQTTCQNLSALKSAAIRTCSKLACHCVSDSGWEPRGTVCDLLWRKRAKGKTKTELIQNQTQSQKTNKCKTIMNQMYFLFFLLLVNLKEFGELNKRETASTA